MLRILCGDFDQNVKNIHDEMYLHHSYKKKRVAELHLFVCILSVFFWFVTLPEFRFTLFWNSL